MGASLFSTAIRHPKWLLNYTGVDITADISEMVTKVIYCDYVAHYTDQLTVAVEDRDRYWQGPWFPARGDNVSLMIGYENEELLPCGEFQVDEVELGGPPDELTIRCIASGIVPSIRTPRWAAYESMTLAQIAQTVASRHQMTLVGVSEAVNVEFARITQSNETDLGFLKRLAQLHNYDFSIRGGQLIFYSRSALEQAPPIATIERTQVETFEFTTRSERVYSTAAVAYQQPLAKQLISQSMADSTAPTSDQLNIVARSEDSQQAALKAQAAIHDANMLQHTGRLKLEGMTLLVAGNNVVISGFGAMNGLYHISGSTHRLVRRDGYSTEVEIRKLS